MLSFSLLLLLFAYSIGLFFVPSFVFLVPFLIVNLIFAAIFKVPFATHLRFLLKSSVFIAFVFLCNLLSATPLLALLIAARLALVTDFTFVMSRFFTPSRLRDACKILLSPLCLFRVDTSALVLSITLALALVPILRDELISIRLALRSKGFSFNLKNLLTRPAIFLTTFCYSLFFRVAELEKALSLRGF